LVGKGSLKIITSTNGLHLFKKPVNAPASLGHKKGKCNSTIVQNNRMGWVVDLKSLIVVYSYHHFSTQKIAEVFAKVLEAKIVMPQQTNPNELEEYGLIGFGAGIDSGKHYQPLLDFAESLPQVTDKKAFIFSTSGISNPKYKTKIHTALREKLQAKGYMIVDEFNCHGFNTNSFLKLLGGMNKGKPDTEDFQHAEEFAQQLKLSMESR
jgi:flavodoxin